MSNEYLPVRLSHLLLHCAVGSIVRGPEFLMTVKDIREWRAKDGSAAGRLIPYVDQVRSALGIEEELREPPIAKELDIGHIDGVCIPAVRFPKWMRCPSCGLLHYNPWKFFRTSEKYRCYNNYKNKKGKDQCKKRPELEQVPWILAHLDGHMADVPWHLLAHRDAKGKEQQKCRADWKEPYLRLIDQNTSNRLIVCNRCNARSDFIDSLRVNFGNTWRQPWIAEAPNPSDELAEVLEINDTRVHYPTTSTALVIPPESRIRKGSVVDRLYSSTQKRQLIERAKRPLALKGALRQVAQEFRCSVSDVESAQREIANGYPLYGKNITQGILLESEHQALIETIPDVADDEDFVTEHYTSTWESMAVKLASDQKPYRIVKSINHLVSVSRLKELMVLRGFQRLGGALVPPDINGGSDWLPALELYGEGVFFSIKEEILTRWEDNGSLRDRARDVGKRFEATGLRFEPEIVVTPRFLLLHTLAHLLVRQLEIEAGYPAASLKERIYCTMGNVPMSSILIYVAVPDVVGSLGGLAELAKPERFLPLLSEVFDHAEWCSLDPVCSEHEGQGPNLLNRAACHACALVPEPSCAYGNVLLDRFFIKGDVAKRVPAFLDYVN